MTSVHAAIGIGALALNAVAAAWGAVAWLRASPSRVFFWLLRAAQAAVVVAVVDGGVVLVAGHGAPDSLHYVYAVAPLVVAVVTEAMRAGVAQRELAGVADPEGLERREQVLLARRIVMQEIGLMTVGLLLTVTLLLRAAQSGGLF